MRKTRTTSEPVTASTSARPYEGSSCSGLGSGSPTARAPHSLQPLLNAPWNLKPQHGQIVKRVYLCESNRTCRSCKDLPKSVLQHASDALCFHSVVDTKTRLQRSLVFRLPYSVRATCDKCGGRRSNKSRLPVPKAPPASDWQSNSANLDE